MTELDQIPASKFQAEDVLQSLNDDDLVQFVLNVGDADCQLLLLPKAPNAPREGIVVDVGVAGKLLRPASHAHLPEGPGGKMHRPDQDHVTRRVNGPRSLARTPQRSSEPIRGPLGA